MSERVPLDAIEPELRKAWKTSTRVRTSTIAAICETPAHAKDAEPALAAMASHGARTILVTASSDGPAEITASASLRPRADSPEKPGGEQIRLHAGGGTRRWVHDAIAKLLLSDLPVSMWWVGDLPDDDALFDAVAPLANAAIVDSNEMDLRDLAALDRIRARIAPRASLVDLGWLRLRPWQELVARFFDDPSAQEILGRIRSLTIEFKPRAPRSDHPFDFVPNQPALLYAWLAGRLGWSIPRWGAEGTVAFLSTKDGRSLEAEFVARSCPLPEGVPCGVVLEAEGARFEVARDGDDPDVICWQGERPGGSIGKQCVRVAPIDAAEALESSLAAPRHDRLYESTLEVAVHAFERIAKGAPAAPARG